MSPNCHISQATPRASCPTKSFLPVTWLLPDLACCALARAITPSPPRVDMFLSDWHFPFPWSGWAGVGGRFPSPSLSSQPHAERRDWRGPSLYLTYSYAFCVLEANSEFGNEKEDPWSLPSSPSSPPQQGDLGRNSRIKIYQGAWSTLGKGNGYFFNEVPKPRRVIYLFR